MVFCSFINFSKWANNKSVIIIIEFLKIIFNLNYDDNTEETIIQQFGGYGHWNFNFIRKNITKFLVYNETKFLYEKEIKDIHSKIEIK